MASILAFTGDEGPPLGSDILVPSIDLARRRMFDVWRRSVACPGNSINKQGNEVLNRSIGELRGTPEALKHHRSKDILVELGESPSSMRNL